MSVRWLMGAGFMYIMCQMVCLIIESAYIGQTEIDIINDLTALDIIDSAGILALPLLIVHFFSSLPQILSWDYSFFTGGYAIIRVIMMCFTIGITWGVIQTFGPSLYGLVSSLMKFGR